MKLKDLIKEEVDRGQLKDTLKDAIENYSPPVEQKNNSKGDDDSPEDKLIKLAKRLQVNTHLTLHGFIANDKLGEMYQHADILIMLSQSKLKSDAEGFGIAILEANLFGVPAIGSIETGIEDAVQDNETGILVNPYLDEEILSAIDNILNNREKLSKNAIKWAKDHNWGKIFKEYLQVIENA